jgi:fatty-acyl-CoA synthase
VSISSPEFRGASLTELIDDRGYLRITGRLKEIINRGARKIAPGEIEALLNSHPAVALTAVIGVPDQRLGEEIAAFVRLAPDATVTEHELARLCDEQLAPFKRPRHWIFLDEMPLTRSGKVHKPTLRDIFDALRGETSERFGDSSACAERSNRAGPQRT